MVTDNSTANNFYYLTNRMMSKPVPEIMVPNFQLVLVFGGFCYYNYNATLGNDLYICGYHPNIKLYTYLGAVNN
jgi:hypothetical protein